MAVTKTDVKIAIVTGLAIALASLAIRSYMRKIEAKR